MTCRTDEEKRLFWEIHDRIEEYYATVNQIVPIRTANVPMQKERVVVELIRNGKPIDTTTEKSIDHTFVDTFPLTVAQPTVDRWIS